jgi:cytochrome b561
MKLAGRVHAFKLTLMRWRNTTTDWGGLSKTFHWVIVVLLIMQLTLANMADKLPLGTEKIAVLARHKSVGITILLLAALRLAWRWMNPVPPYPQSLGRLQRFLARSTHFALYALLFAMPLSGWMMSSARNFPVSWFGLVQLPDLVPADRRLYEIFHNVHESLAVLLLLAVILHIVGALWHHFVLKDDTLRRMLPFARRPQSTGR